MKALITGGTGLVGTRVAESLTVAGHEVVLLSRAAAMGGPYRTFS